MTQESVPCLPMEILEEIIGYHGRKVEGKASTTLLACLSTSRQFRECVLRHLCTEVPVYLDRPDQLKRLHDCITPAGFMPYMKSVTIIFASRPHLRSDRPPRLNEDVVLPLLRTFINQLCLRALTLQGRSWVWGNVYGAMSWDGMPSETRLLLQSLLQVPTVTCVSCRWFQDIPPQLFAQRSYEAVTFADGQMLTSSSVTRLDTTYLTLDDARLMNFSIPNLRHIKVTASTFHGLYLPSSDVIKHCRDTLETIQIQEATAPIPQDVKFHMFPRLEKFTHTFCTYTPETLETHPILIQLLLHAQTSNVVCNLKILDMTIFLIDREEYVSPASDFGARMLTVAATNPFWAYFDNVLAKRHYFPALRKVSISLKFKERNVNFSGPSTNDLLTRSAVNTEALRKVHSALLKTFSASIEASIPIEIVVGIDPPS